jgi:hypothetical protein
VLGAVALVARLTLTAADGLVRQIAVRVEICTVVALGAGLLGGRRKEMLPAGDMGVVACGALAGIERCVERSLQFSRGPGEIVAILADLIRGGSRVQSVMAQIAVALLEGRMSPGEKERGLLGMMRLMTRRAVHP